MKYSSYVYSLLALTFILMIQCGTSLNDQDKDTKTRTLSEVEDQVPETARKLSSFTKNHLDTPDTKYVETNSIAAFWDDNSVCDDDCEKNQRGKKPTRPTGPPGEEDDDDDDDDDKGDDDDDDKGDDYEKNQRGKKPTRPTGPPGGEDDDDDDDDDKGDDDDDKGDDDDDATSNDVYCHCGSNARSTNSEGGTTYEANNLGHCCELCHAKGYDLSQYNINSNACTCGTTNSKHGGECVYEDDPHQNCCISS